MPFAWPAIPPEIAEALLSGGDKAATTADAGAAHGALTGMMGADGVSMTVNAGTTAPMFQGLGGVQAIAAAGQYAPMAEMAAGWIAEGASVMTELALHYTATRSSMIPSAVALGTRETAEGWTAANWHGFFTPIVMSWWELYGNQWLQNATLGSGWEAAVHAAAGPLLLPGPIAPLMANPAGVAAEAGAVAGTGAERASSVAMRQSFEGLQKAVNSPVGGSQAGGMEAMSTMMQFAQAPMSMVSGLGSAFGGAPQTLGQLPQMGMGMLGPLLSGPAMQAANPQNALNAAMEAARQSAANPAMASSGAGGAGFGGPSSGATAPMSAFSRANSALTAPSSPAARMAPAAGTFGGGSATSGSAGGGMFGAPGAAGRRKENQTQAGSPVAVMYDGERSDRGE